MNSLSKQLYTAKPRRPGSPVTCHVATQSGAREHVPQTQVPEPRHARTERRARAHVLAASQQPKSPAIFFFLLLSFLLVRQYTHSQASAAIMILCGRALRINNSGTRRVARASGQWRLPRRPLSISRPERGCCCGTRTEYGVFVERGSKEKKRHRLQRGRRC
jgi:hypothetical protein